MKKGETGIEITISKQDESGERKVETNSYGLDENLKEDRRGIATYRWKYNDKGNLVEKSCHGIDGKLKENSEDGVAIVRYTYSENGRLLSKTNFRLNEFGEKIIIQ